ncbi:MAG: serine/threonine protein kinase [Ktedonobacteraceae bacterium]|nr:serine/threonine protein kinase [Ktedonobacteraceae bacterium]
MNREDDLINEKIEGYRIAAELISTSFRSIFLGESISSTDPYQLVVIELFYSASTYMQQETLDKISFLQQMHHPHILPILATGFYKENPYIITEYLSSGSLYGRFQRRVAGQPIQMKEAILTLAQVGQALYYAHQRQVIHGSLNPQNILFTSLNEVQVTGFHQHTLLSPDEIEGGTDQEISIYQAPEQQAGQVNEKSDQYSFACIAYALVTGTQPFMVPSVNTPGTYYKTRSLIPPGRLNSGLPLYIESAILKAMSREPEQRYPDVATFLAALGIPSTGRKSELKETVALLAQIMQGDAETPLLPELEIDTLDTTKMLEVTPTRDGKRANADTFSLVPSDKGEPEALVMPANAIVLPGQDVHPHEQPHAPINLQQAYTDKKTSSFLNGKKSLVRKPGRAFAVILCLLAFLVICISILVNMNFFTQRNRPSTLPSIHETSVAQSSTQTGVTVPIPTITAQHTPSSTPGIGVPSSQPTPQQTGIPKKTPTPPQTATPPGPPTQMQVSLNQFFNNKGMGYAPGQANFDGSGYSYPADLLPSGEQITIQGVPYQFPAGSGQADNIVTSGQTISLQPGTYRQAFLLAAASWGPVTSSVVIQYTDGSTSTKKVTVLDWYSSHGIMSATYRYTPNAVDHHHVYLFAIPINLDTTRIVNTLTLSGRQSGPHHNGHIHIFALTLMP